MQSRDPIDFTVETGILLRNVFRFYFYFFQKLLKLNE